MTLSSPTLRRQVFIWSLYDFANSFALAVFGLYFSDWLVVQHQVSDLKFNMIFIVSSLLLLFTAPLAGVLIDKVGVKLPSLRIVTIYSFISLAAVGSLAVFAPVTPMVINLVIALLVVGQYFYQFSFIFYNPLLKELGTEEEHAKISGLGQAAGGLGQIIGLTATLPLASGAIYLFGNRGESQVFLPTAIIFLILTLPMLLLFKEQKRPPQHIRINLTQEIRGLWKQFLSLGRYPGVHRFLLAFFFFNDAVLTASHNFPIYVEQVFSLSHQTRSLMLGSIMVAAALGAAGSGWIARRLGTKHTLDLVLGCWIIILPLIALQQHVLPFWVLISVMGILLGASGATARATLTYLTPEQDMAHAFSYYAMTERLASFIGPFAWGLVTSIFADFGSARYQVALLTMTIFIALGLWILQKVPRDQYASIE